MHNRKIRNSQFNLPCMREMWKTLGEYDALAEYLELTSRHFLSEYGSVEQSIEFADYLKAIAKQEKVPIRDLTLLNYRSYSIQMFLTLPNSSFERFADGLKEDFYVLFGKKISYPQNGSTYEQIITALKDYSIRPRIEKYKVDLYDYYRLLRNEFAHHMDSVKKLYLAYKKIDTESLLSYYDKLSAPEEPSKLVFNDYILCTANIKNIADIITESLGAKVDWIDYSRRNAALFKKLRGRNLNNRVYASVQNKVKTLYGITLDIELCKRMYEAAMEELGA